uniref:Uncharacterized protein n=1 Tax=Aegilops tauschii subsp. strangulata TaxID=200361 RepID=A0A453DC03_AEGTS
MTSRAYRALNRTGTDYEVTLADSVTGVKGVVLFMALVLTFWLLTCYLFGTQ